jgi:signal transduction histidine kinase/CheY-like chemotaxis protein/HPt (histidine-containing phosphotransfer) domain-containing protein
LTFLNPLFLNSLSNLFLLFVPFLMCSSASAADGKVSPGPNAWLYEGHPVLFVLLCALFLLTVFTVEILRRKNKKLVETQKNLYTAEELLSRDRELLDVKERLEIALAASASGVWEVDLDRKVVTCDAVTRRMLRFHSEGEMPLKEFMDKMGRIQEDFWESDFCRGLVTGKLGDGGLPDEVTLIHSEEGEGAERSYQRYYRVVRDGDGRAVRVVGMLIDITSRIGMERDLKAARDAAEAASQTKSHFLSSISHEIRTPMNAIIGMSGLLMAENLTDTQMKYVSDIRTSSTSLLAITNDVLDLSKMDAGKFTITPVVFDFSELLSNISSIFTLAAKEKGISFLFSAGEGLPRCLFGDDVRLRQILINIIGNGIKFTDTGHVLLRVSARGDMFCFDISDTGPGIREENLDLIFDSFAQFDRNKNRKRPGTGLGLPITKSLVDLMNGRIEVRSEYGRGTLFHVELPLVPRDRDPARNDEPVASFVTAPTARALVVDDNEMNLNVMVGMLRLHRLDCDVAPSGMEALKKIEAANDGGARYDLVFMDHMMPDMDGLETTVAIRKNERTERKHVIVALTANAVGGVRETLIGGGMDDYLAKPLQENLLNEMLKKWLPKEKIVNTASPYGEVGSAFLRSKRVRRLNDLDELDLKTCLNRVNGMVEVYEESIGVVVRKLPGVVEKLERCLGGGDMKNFTVEIHGTKGSLANIGATALSERAGLLENAAKDGDVEFCGANTPRFLEEVRALHRKLEAIVSEEEDHVVPKEAGSIEDLKKKLTVARTLLDSFADVEAANIVKEVLKFNYDSDTNLKLKNLMNFILEFDYAETFTLIGQMIG